MKARLPIVIGFLAVLLCFGLFIRQRSTDHLSPTFFSPEPRFGDEGLSYWLMHLFRYNQQGRQVDVTSKEALLQIGTNAVPLLLDWIARPDPPGPGVRFPQHAVEGFEILGPIAKPAIPKLIANIGNDSGHSMRALQFIGKDAVVPLAEKLLETLEDTSEPVTNWRDPRYRKGYYHIQGCVIRCLSEMGTNAEAAIPALMKALYPKRGWQWENSSCEALVSVGKDHPEIVIPALIDAFTNSASPDFKRGAIAHALAGFGTNQANTLLPVFINAMTNETSSAPERCWVAGPLSIVGQNHPKTVVPVLVFALTNTPLRGRGPIADALATYGGEARQALPILLESSRQPSTSDQDNRWRISLAVAAKQIAPETNNTLAPLFEDLQRPAPFIRQQTIWALGKLGTNAVEAIPALMQCLSHSDSQTRIDATKALCDIGAASDDFIITLGENLAHTNQFVADVALSALIQSADESKLAFVTAIKKGISGPIARDVREQAKYGLIDIAQHNPHFLLQCLDHPDTGVRAGALKVFYDLARAVPASIPKLQLLVTNDPDSYVRDLATDVLRLQQQ